MVNRRYGMLGAVVVGAMLLAACGSRRPLADFQALNSVATPGAQQQQSAITSDEPGSPATAVSQPPSVDGQPTNGSPGEGTGPEGGRPTTDTNAATQGPAANFASDVGVTATTINLGNVTTKSGGFGEDQFTPFYYGAAAYFQQLNSNGGINGRKVLFNFCDDGGNASGNESCVRKFVDDQKVFSLVASVCLACDGLSYASAKDIPFVGGVGIDFKDYALPHTYRYSGNYYPTNGQIGYKGKLYQNNFQYAFIMQKFGISKAGVIYYDNSVASKSQGLAIAQLLKSVGLQVTTYPINVALPNYDSAVIDMKSRGITGLWDSLDITGNQNLCKSINSNGAKLAAKVSTIAEWSQEVATQFQAPCRDMIVVLEDPGALTYDQTSNPEIAKFRAAFKTYFPDRQDKLFQWSVDGWASAMWFTDAAASCGANLTRVCLEKFLSNPAGYSAHGLWYAPTHSVAKIDLDRVKTQKSCIGVGKWDDATNSFKNIASMPATCGVGTFVSSPAPS